MKKYYIGLLVLTILTGVLAMFVITQGLSGKQDVKTSKKANEITTSLNNYIDSKQAIPDSLEQAGIKEVPSTIKYTKTSKEEYQFCVTYKTAGGDDIGGVSGGLWLSALGWLSAFQGYPAYDDGGYYGGDTYTQSYLYMDPTHKAGENCKTIKPYFYDSSYLKSATPTAITKTSIPATTAKDIERETDIKALHAQIEAYYAQNGRYPTLSNMNDAIWLAANMKGLDKEALKDPDGTSTTLASYPVSKIYSYEAKASDGLTCDNQSFECVAYTLSASLGNGSVYTKTNLN